MTDLPTHLHDGQWDTFQVWVDTATRSIGGTNALCADAIGRVCRIGADFMRARDEGTFPVRYWHGCGPQTTAEQRKSARAADRMLHPWRPKKLRQAIEREFERAQP